MTHDFLYEIERNLMWENQVCFFCKEQFIEKPVLSFEGGGTYRGLTSYNICSGVYAQDSDPLDSITLLLEVKLARTEILNETRLQNNRKTFIVLKCVHPTIKKTK